MDNDVETIIQQIAQETDIFAKAKLINTLLREKNIRIVDVARSLQRTPSYICHLIRLTHLPEIIIDGYYSRLISISHLFVISRIKDEKKLLELYELLLKNNYTVLQTEELVREALYDVKSNGRHLAKKEILELVNKIKEKNNDMQIKVIQTRIKGKIVFEIRGSLEHTSQALKNLLKKLMS